MKLLLACALLATASAFVTTEVYDNPHMKARSKTQYKSAYIPDGQCSGWIPYEALGCKHTIGVAHLNVTVDHSNFEIVEIDLHSGKEVTIVRSWFCFGRAEVTWEVNCGLIGSSDKALPEVPRAPSHAPFPRGHQDPAPLPPAPNSY